MKPPRLDTTDPLDAPERGAAVPFRANALAHADALYNFARHLTGSPSDAEDLVQDTYARAFGAAAQVDGDMNVRAWLYRILRNAFVDRYRRSRREVTRADVDREDEGELLRGDAELDRLRGVVAEEIEAALQALSHDGRAVILLDLDGLSEAEMAQILGCPANTVKSRLARARVALRSKLKDYAR